MHLELAAVEDIKELGIGRQRDEELTALADRVDRIVVAATGVEADLISYLKDLCRARQVKISVVSPLHGRRLPRCASSRSPTCRCSSTRPGTRRARR